MKTLEKTLGIGGMVAGLVLTGVRVAYNNDSLSYYSSKFFMGNFLYPAFNIITAIKPENED